MDHKLLEFGTKLQFNPLLQVLWAQRLYSIFCPGKQSQIIFVKKKKKKRLPGRKFHLVLRKISPEAAQPLSLQSVSHTPKRQSHPTWKPSGDAKEVGHLLLGMCTIPSCSPPPSARLTVRIQVMLVESTVWDPEVWALVQAHHHFLSDLCISLHLLGLTFLMQNTQDFNLDPSWP